MEIILAIVVTSAVIFFGALISMGNERQRKAIDRLCDKVSLWAMQDLKIKREQLGQNVRVPDPLDWLNKAAARVCGYELGLQILEIFEIPPSLVCATGDGTKKVIFSPLSPADLRKTKYKKRSRLSQSSGHSPILYLPKHVNIYEMSLLNEGHLFDLELALGWKELTGQDLEGVNEFWMYVFSITTK